LVSNLYRYSYSNGWSQYHQHLHYNYFRSYQRKRWQFKPFTKSLELCYWSFWLLRRYPCCLHRSLFFKKNNFHRGTWNHWGMYVSNWCFHRLRITEHMPHLHEHRCHNFPIHNGCSFLGLRF